MSNKNAVALGKMAKGKRKRYSAEEIKRRTELLERARAAKADKRLVILNDEAKDIPEEVWSAGERILPKLDKLLSNNDAK